MNDETNEGKPEADDSTQIYELLDKEHLVVFSELIHKAYMKQSAETSKVAREMVNEMRNNRSTHTILMPYAEKIISILQDSTATAHAIIDLLEKVRADASK